MEALIIHILKIKVIDRHVLNVCHVLMFEVLQYKNNFSINRLIDHILIRYESLFPLMIQNSLYKSLLIE